MCRPILGCFLIAAIASLGFAPAPVYKPPKVAPRKPSMDILFGYWHNPKSPSVVVHITPTEFAYINSGQRNNVYKLTVDTTKSPMWYDIRQGGANFVGLIKVEGDTLTVLYNSEQRGVQGAGRPLNWDSTGHREIYYRQQR